MLPRSRDLLWPLIVSAAGWPLYALLFIKFPGTNLEGLFIIVGFCSLALFTLAGPLAGAMLGHIMQSSPLTFARFLGLFFILTFPMIAFQAVAVGVSVVQVFLPQTFAGAADSVGRFMLLAGLLTVCIYGVEAIALYLLAKKGETWSNAGASLLVVGTMLLGVVMVTHR